MLIDLPTFLAPNNNGYAYFLSLSRHDFWRVEFRLHSKMIRFISDVLDNPLIIFNK